MEIKSFVCSLNEVKFEEGDANNPMGKFSGWASVWDSIDLGGDTIERGAYKNTLKDWAGKGMMPQMLFYHDYDNVIGEWTKMQEDDRGLYVEGRLWVKGDERIEQAVKAYNILKSNSVRGLSIGYVAKDYELMETMTGTYRKLKEIELREVSIAPWSMEPKAKVTNVKSLMGEDGQPVSKRECEKILRDAGLSTRQAKAFISGGYNAMSRDDSEDYGEALASLDHILNTLKG